MFNQTFYHGTIENYVKIFSRLFQSIEIKRRDTAGNVTQTLPIPLQYGYKDTQLSQVLQDPDQNRQIQVTLPRMSFIWDGSLQSDFDQSGLSPLRRIISEDPSTPDLNLTQFQMVPYKMGFTLSIMVNKVKDGTQILEQIIPFFTPDFNITVNLIPGYIHKDNLNIKLENIQADHRIKGSATDNNVMTWDLTFSMKVKFYGPIQRVGLIKHIMLDFHPNTKIDTPKSTTVNITPGLTVDGDPTSDPNQTISIDQIRKDDPWGIIKQFQDFI